MKEITEIIARGLREAFNMGLKQSPFDAENSEFYMPLLELTKAPHIAKDLEAFIDAEVEKRIAERMPSEMEFTQMVAGHIPWAIKPMRRSKTQFVNPFTSGNAFEQVISILSENLYKELCSRLTPQVTPQDTPQVQKTEGGEG